MPFDPRSGFAVPQPAAASKAPIFGQTTYTPTITSSGAGVIAVLGAFLAVRTGDNVIVTGNFSFNPAVGGTPETLSIPCPTEAGFAPAANFDNAGDVNGGLAHGGAAADFVEIQVRAQTSSKKADVKIDQATASAVEHGVWFSYRMAGV